MRAYKREKLTAAVMLAAFGFTISGLTNSAYAAQVSERTRSDDYSITMNEAGYTGTAATHDNRKTSRKQKKLLKRAKKMEKASKA